MKTILKRQIRKYLKDFSDDQISQLQPFLWAVLDMYQSFDDDRKLMDRSLDISSRELLEKNEKLSKNSETVNIVLQDMLRSIQDLDNRKKVEVENMEIEDLSHYLQDLIRSVKRSKIEAVKQKNYLFTIVDSIWEGLMVINNEGNIVMFNKMSQELTWYLAPQVINKHYSDFDFFYNEKTKEPYSDFIGKTMSEHTMEFISESVALRNIHKHFTSVSIITSPMWALSRDDMGCVIVFRDISQERELDRMKDEFVSIASHELRTPMTVINGYAWLLLTEKTWALSQEQANYVQKIKWNTIQLINLVNDMLSLSRAESGKMEVHKEEYDLGQQLYDISAGFADLFLEKWIKLSYPQRMYMINSDAGKVGEVLTNLIWNASKFTKEWGQVEIGTIIHAKHIEIYVQDTWEGISDENIWKLFQKFAQVNSHLHNKAEGTGLWLAICKMLVEMLGWQIFVESELWKGSRFSFTLPKD